MAKATGTIVFGICIAYTLFQKCIAEITVSSFVDVTLLPSADVQLMITKNISSKYSSSIPEILASSVIINDTSNGNTTISTNHEKQKDNHSIDVITPTIPLPISDEQSTDFSYDTPPSELFFTNKIENISENESHFQTPQLNLSVLSSVSQNLYFHTYFATEPWPDEYSENYVSLISTQFTLFPAPTTSNYDYNSLFLERSVISSILTDVHGTTKITASETESVSSSYDIKVLRMGKEVTISALNTSSSEVYYTTSLESSKMLHTTNLPDNEVNLHESESISKIQDDNPSSTNSQILVSVGIEENMNENDSNIPNTKHVVLILKKDCIGVNIFQNMFAVLNTHLMGLLSSVSEHNTNINTVNCDAFFHLKLSIDSVTDNMVKKVANVLLSNITFGEDLKVEKVFCNSDDYEKFLATPQTKNDQNNELFVRREVIAYIVAGICLGLLTCALMACCCTRMLCKKQTNSLDLCDIPHLNLKLEDYKLTPIPRPTISFPEYGRELFNPTYNDPAPRMEDTILNQHHFSGDTNSGVKDLANNSREMRTFGGKRSCTRVQSLDVRPNMRAGNGWMSNSTEKLNSDFEKKSGYDNSGFRKWF